MTDLKTLRQTLRDLAEHAPKWQAQEMERVSHDRGEFSYEINRDDMFVAFYEDHFKPVMKAKFAADLFASANPENILRLLDALETAEAALEKYADSSGRIMVPNENGHTEHCRENGCYGHFIDQKVNTIADEALSKLRGGR